MKKSWAGFSSGAWIGTGCFLYVLGFVFLPAMKLSGSAFVTKTASVMDGVFYEPPARATKDSPFRAVWQARVDIHVYWCKRSDHCKVVQEP